MIETTVRGRSRSGWSVSGRLPLVRPLLTSYNFMRRWPVVPLAVLVLLLIAGLFAPQLAPREPNYQSLSDRKAAPAWDSAWYAEHSSSGGPYLLDADQLGRDILSRIIHGARISVLVVATTECRDGNAGRAVSAVLGHRQLGRRAHGGLPLRRHRHDCGLAGQGAGVVEAYINHSQHLFVAG